jgi:hypothetical protein
MEDFILLHLRIQEHEDRMEIKIRFKGSVGVFGDYP